MILLDTHIMWWLGYQPQRISDVAADAIRASYPRKDGIALSAASVYELTWLLDRGRLVAEEGSEMFLREIDRRFLILPVDGPTAQRAARIPAPFHGDPMDRIIVATALETGRTLITADSAILASNICPVRW